MFHFFDRLLAPAALRRTGLGVSLAVGAASLSLAAVLRRPLPRIRGSLALKGVRAPVEVLRDRWGVPHLYAANAHDLFFAQGFVHAQDRLWQMELNRRTGHGQLAELFGPLALDADRFLRTLGFTRVAQRELEAASPEVRLALDGYAAGVNAFVAANQRRLPVEFTLLRVAPRPWKPLDSLVWAKIMALNLSNNWTTELLRARLVAVLGAERAAALETGYPNKHPLTVPPNLAYGPLFGTGALQAAEAAKHWTGDGTGPQGSNAWAVGGTRSASGKPMLASDPHLGLQLPALWHEIGLHSPEYEAAGVGLPGAPGVIIGHTARIAWGITNGMVDTQDVYVEQRHPDDPQLYLHNGAWERAELVRETITVRGQAEPHVETVQLTRHGPIISHLVPDAAPGDPPLALRWTTLDPGPVQQAVLKLNRAIDWDSFRDALRDWHSPPQNFVYADVDGQIGYALGGTVPQRAQGDGRLPVPGEGGYEWQGAIPYNELPRVLDPAEGLVVTANNRIVGDDFPHSIAGEWFSGYRAARIRSLLEARPHHDMHSFGAIQNDRLSLPGLELAALVERLTLRDPLEHAAQQRLAKWNGAVDIASIGATIYAATRYHLLHEGLREVEQVLGTVVGLGPFASLPGSSFRMRALPGLLQQLTSGDNNGLLERAFRAAVGELRAVYGADPRRWSYGRSHRFTIRHPLGGVKGLGPLLNRGPLPIPGDIDTVCMGNIPRDPVGGQSCIAPSYRILCDTADWDATLSVLPGGQSGHPGSRHYADQFGLWQRGGYKPLLWSRTKVEAASVARLVLTPL